MASTFATCLLGQGGNEAAAHALGLVIEGKLDPIPPLLARELGLTIENIGSLKTPDARGWAVEILRETGSEDAYKYFQSLSQTDLADDESLTVWPMTQVALYSLRLDRINDATLRREFLEEAASKVVGGSVTNWIQKWAVDQLCDSGTLISFPVVQKSILRRDPLRRGVEDVVFCEARMRVIASHADRSKALATVLKVPTGPMEDRLLLWAVAQLSKLRTPESWQLLRTYSPRIEAVPVPDRRHSMSTAYALIHLAAEGGSGTRQMR